MAPPITTLPLDYTLRYTINLKENKLLQIVLQLASVVLLIGFGWLFLWVLAAMRPQATGSFSISIGPGGMLWLLAGGLAIVIISVLVIVIHEAVHGVFFWLFTQHRPVFGFQVWYAYAGLPEGVYIRRNPYLVVGLAPLVVLSLVGVALFAIVPPLLLWPVFIFVTINAAGAVGDMMVAGWLLFQPASALIHDSGDVVRLYARNQDSGARC
jgi:hypothetical protein